MSDLRFLKPFVWFAVSIIVFLSLSRAGLVIWQGERVTATDNLFFIFAQGLRFDLVLIGMVLFIPLSLTPLILIFKQSLPVWRIVVTLYLALLFVAVVFVELSTPSFINQFDLRPNVLYVEYLKYPKEVISTLWEAYKLQLIFTIIFSALSFKWLYGRLKTAAIQVQAVRWWKAILLSPLLLLLAVMMARSTLGHRGVNPSTVAFSSDPMVNTLPLSSAYSVLYALREMMNESQSNVQYGKLPDDEVSRLVKQEMGIDEQYFTAGQQSTLHFHEATHKREKPLNLVIVLEESLGAEFVGSLGGLPLTPELDKLTKEGMWLNNLYATGTRSVRGIEAVVTGFTPTPLRSVVKLTKSQTNFFTIAQLLKEKGYDTSFIYGGEAHFDNMKRFFASNGFDKIIEEPDFKNPVFTGSWGASDEDLFSKAHESFSSYEDGQPFFSLVFTSTNHSPFEFPDGRIELYDEEKQTVNNAVKYADYALGEFIRKAKKSKYWENTVFLIVADHNSRVYGAEIVPIERFHIPALILGADVKPQTYSRLASQIDLLPTLLSIMGVDATYPAIGRDLTRSTMPGRAIMQFDTTQAYMQEDGNVAIMQKHKEPVQYVYKKPHLSKAEQQDPELMKKALAHSIWSLRSYLESSYRLK
ncbi:MAG: LTA synthase family protein [Gammaproteobacteria bacterium]|nr:LTA synthase family protein [Gammaproteobacteria bacterium]